MNLIYDFYPFDHSVSFSKLQVKTLHFLAGFGQRDFVAACGSVWTWDDVSWPDEKQAIGHYLLALIIMTSTSLDANFLSQKSFLEGGSYINLHIFHGFSFFSPTKKENRRRS